MFNVRRWWWHLMWWCSIIVAPLLDTWLAKKICKHFKKINVRKQWWCMKWWHMKWWRSIIIASRKEPCAASGKSAANIF